MLAAGAGYLVNSFALWLFVRGVNRDRWAQTLNR